MFIDFLKKHAHSIVGIYLIGIFGVMMFDLVVTRSPLNLFHMIGFMMTIAGVAVVLVLFEIEALKKLLPGDTAQVDGTVAVPPERPHRYDVEHSLIHSLTADLVRRGMSANAVGEFVRQVADSLLTASAPLNPEPCTCGLNEGCSNCPKPKRVELDMRTGMPYGAAGQAAGHHWEELRGDAAGRVTVGCTEPQFALASTPVEQFKNSVDAHADRLAAAKASLSDSALLISEKWAASIELCGTGEQADQRAEAEIVAKGLTAPRVTAEHIQSLMDRLTWRYEHEEGTRHTFAHAFLDDFFVATGHNAPVSRENFDASLGMKYAREQAEGKARDKLWELEGYALHKALKVFSS